MHINERQNFQCTLHDVRIQVQSGLEWIAESILSAHDTCLSSGAILGNRLISLVDRACAAINDFVSIKTSLLALSVCRTFQVVGNTSKSTLTKVIDFISGSWKLIVNYIIVWGTIILYFGLLYGFESVAYPLAIGLGCGIGGGAIIGILMTLVINPKNHFPDYNTPWNGLNHIIENLDVNGTRQIVLGIAITAILATAVIYPYVIGTTVGLLIGWQISAKLLTGKNLGKDPEKHKNIIADLQQQVAEMTVQLNQLAANVPPAH